MKSEVDEGAMRMRAAADKATAAMKTALIKVIEDMLPEDENPRNAARQIGTIITACSMLYGDMLGTIAKSGNMAEAVLAAGMVQNFVAEPLQTVANVAGGAGGIEVHTN
jgi:hypothetical protein